MILMYGVQYDHRWNNQTKYTYIYGSLLYIYSTKSSSNCNGSVSLIMHKYTASTMVISMSLSLFMYNNTTYNCLAAFRVVNN